MSSLKRKDADYLPDSNEARKKREKTQLMFMILDPMKSMW